MTGVAPVTYDDLTSGFNIADIITLNPRFDKMIGVTETELNQMIAYYLTQVKIQSTADEIVEQIKPWYDNFCFAEESYKVEPSLYNTNMVLRYIKHLITIGNPPKMMIDYSARTDYNKLDFLVMAEDLDNRDRRIEIIRQICADGYTIGNVKEQFPAALCGDEENFKSMLYYYGTLTFGGYDHNNGTKLVVPNKTMGELYLQYMLRIAIAQGFDLEGQWHNLQEKIKQAALDFQWEPLITYLGQIYNRYSSIRNAIQGEADIQGFVRGLLCLNDYYAIWLELELGKGFCDVLLIPKTTPSCLTKYSYLIEIKYMKEQEKNVDKYISEACDQLDRYISEKTSLR